MSKKNTTTTPLAGSSVLPKVLGTLFLLGVLAVILKYPADSGMWVQALATWLGTAIDGVAAFLQQLAS